MSEPLHAHRVGGPWVPWPRPSMTVTAKLVAVLIAIVVPVYGLVVASDAGGRILSLSIPAALVVATWHHSRRRIEIDPPELRLGPWVLATTDVATVRRLDDQRDLDAALARLREQGLGDLTDPRRVRTSAVAVIPEQGPWYVVTPPDPDAFVDLLVSVTSRAGTPSEHHGVAVSASLRAQGVRHATAVRSRRAMRAYRWQARQQRSRWFRVLMAIGVVRLPIALAATSSSPRWHGIRIGDGARTAPRGLLIDLEPPREDHLGRYDALLVGLRHDREVDEVLAELAEGAVEVADVARGEKRVAAPWTEDGNDGYRWFVPGWIRTSTLVLAVVVAVTLSILGVVTLTGGESAGVAFFGIAAVLAWPLWRRWVGGPRPLAGRLPLAYALRSALWAVAVAALVLTALAAVSEQWGYDETEKYPAVATAIVERSDRADIRKPRADLRAVIGGRTVRQAVAGSYPEGSTVEVRYDPVRPDALIVPGTGRGGDLTAALLIGGGFGVLALLLRTRRPQVVWEHREGSVPGPVRTDR